MMNMNELPEKWNTLSIFGFIFAVFNITAVYVCSITEYTAFKH